MQIIPQLLCAVGILALAFGWWGVYTRHGRQVFDEMAGMIPMGVGALGGVLVAIGVIWLLVRYFAR